MYAMYQLVIVAFYFGGYLKISEHSFNTSQAILWHRIITKYSSKLILMIFFYLIFELILNWYSDQMEIRFSCFISCIMSIGISPNVCH